jgi:hypothetical protein
MLKSFSIAFSVNNSGSIFIVVFLSNPLSGEGGEVCKGRSSLPDAVLTVGRRNDTKISTSRGLFGDLRLEPLGNTLVHGGTTSQNDVLTKFFSYIYIGGRNRRPSAGRHRLSKFIFQIS